MLNFLELVLRIPANPNRSSMHRPEQASKRGHTRDRKPVRVPVFPAYCTLPFHHRFGSSLNGHVHFLVCMVDGVLKFAASHFQEIGTYDRQVTLPKNRPPCPEVWPRRMQDLNLYDPSITPIFDANFSKNKYFCHLKTDTHGCVGPV